MHHLDSRTKLILSFAFIIILCSWPTGSAAYVLCAAGIAAVTLVSRIPFKMLLKSLKPIAFLAAFTALLNCSTPRETCCGSGGSSRSPARASNADLYGGAHRLLIASTSLLTYTTSPVALTDAIETLFRPLNKIHLPVHEFAMMMTIALRFIPTLIEETEKIMNAQKARGADFESGNLLNRAKALVPVLVPLFVSAFRRADELSIAMECRLYRGGEGRTRLKQLKMGKNDGVAFAISILFFACVMIATRILP